MPPQTNITEKRIRMSIILFMHINVGAGLALSRVGFLEQGENKEEERATRRDFLIR